VEEAAWAAIAALPDATMPEIDAKRSELRRFCLEYADSPHFEIAAELGEDLDYKREFLRKYDSEFGLLRFARKDTPYREAAQKRLAELQAQAAAAPAEPPPPPAVRQAPSQPKPQPQAPQPPAGFILIPGGTFLMGDVLGDKEESDETVHEVTLSDFYLGRHAVTFAEYDAFCEATGREKPSDSGWGRGQRPAINVSWYDAVEYCNWRSQQEGRRPYYAIDKSQKDPNNTNDGDDLKWIVTPEAGSDGYRLPTEAEWEYAAREGGRKVRFGNGKDIADPKEINFDGSKDYKKPYSVVGEYRGKTVPVGSLNSPNALGCTT
jgi:formylglycine-generating enzyme